MNYEDTGTTFYFIALTFVVATIMFKFLLSLIINNFVESSEKIEKMKRYQLASAIKSLTIDEQIYRKLLLY